MPPDRFKTLHERWLKNRNRVQHDASYRDEWWAEQCGKCSFWVPLSGDLGLDYGACTSAGSRFDGTVRFEHDGCDNFESADRWRLPAEQPQSLFPQVVARTRYGGTYSGGSWIAYVPTDNDLALPDAAFAGDVECARWWLADGAEHPDTNRIGRGETPHHAIADLDRRWRQAGSPASFSWRRQQQ